MMIAHGGQEPVLGAENADWGSMTEMMREMMPYKFGGGGVLWQAHWVLGLITWVLIIALLVALTRYFWKKTK